MTELFELVEAALDEITFLVLPLAVIDEVTSVLFWRNNGRAFVGEGLTSREFKEAHSRNVS